MIYGNCTVPIIFGLVLASVSGCLAVEGAYAAYEQDLRNGKIIVDQPEPKGEHEVSGRAVGVIDASVEKVWVTIRDYNNMSEFMPNIPVSHMVNPGVLNEIGDQKEWGRRPFERMLASYKSESLCGDTVYLYNVLNMPFPVADRWFLLKVILNPDRHSVSWSLIVGNMKVNRGSWELRAFDGNPQETLVTYTSYSNSGIAIPRFIINQALKSTLPNVIEGVRKRTRELFDE